MKPPVNETGGGLKYAKKSISASWFSFGTARRKETIIPATLSEALIRLHLVYPLASLDVSGQWPVYLAAAWPNEGSICLVTIPLSTKNVKKYDPNNIHCMVSVRRKAWHRKGIFFFIILPLLFNLTPGIVDQKLPDPEIIG